MTRWNTGSPLAGTITTPDANPVTCVSFDPATGADQAGGVVGPLLSGGDAIVHARGLLLGQSGANKCRLYAERSFQVVGGVVSALDPAQLAPVPDFIPAALAGVEIRLNTVGVLFRLRAVGIAATTITWTGYLWLYSGEFVG